MHSLEDSATVEDSPSLEKDYFEPGINFAKNFEDLALRPPLTEAELAKDMEALMIAELDTWRLEDEESGLCVPRTWLTIRQETEDPPAVDEALAPTRDEAVSDPEPEPDALEELAAGGKNCGAKHFKKLQLVGEYRFTNTG